MAFGGLHVISSDMYSIVACFAEQISNLMR